MKDLNIITKKLNFFSIQTNIDQVGLYAFYLYKNKEIIERIPYRKCDEYIFENLKPGHYKVKVFRKTKDNIESIVSKSVDIINISQSTRENFKVVIDSPNYDLLWISQVLSEKYHIEHYISEDDTILDSFNNLKPITHVNALKNDYTIVTCDSLKAGVEGYSYVSLSQGSDNILNEYLSHKSTAQLQTISRDLYMNGLEKGSHYIWIYMRRNTSCSISYKTKIGENFELGLGGLNTVIHPNATIGNFVKIAQQVTVGFNGGKEGAKGPIIGNNVYIAPGSMCLGGKIGDNVIIGANSTVLTDIPSNSVVAGTPAKIISSDISKYKNYLPAKKVLTT